MFSLQHGRDGYYSAWNMKVKLLCVCVDLLVEEAQMCRVAYFNDYFPLKFLFWAVTSNTVPLFISVFKAVSTWAPMKLGVAGACQCWFKVSFQSYKTLQGLVTLPGALQLFCSCIHVFTAMALGAELTFTECFSFLLGYLTLAE